jgi:hypothetical protein
VKLKPPRLRLLGRAGSLAIYLVDGERVRNEIDIDFVNGGNGAVYPGDQGALSISVGILRLDVVRRVLRARGPRLPSLIHRGSWLIDVA